MTLDEATDFIDTHLIMSLGTLPHGYVMYAETAKILVNKIYDNFEQHIAELEEPKGCGGCIHIDTKGSCYDCSRYYTDYYEPKDNK